MTKPVGEFNHGRLVVDHGKVQHWLNGVKVVEYDLNSPEFKARVAATKFKQWPQFATGKSGAIALQMPRRRRRVPEHQDQGHQVRPAPKGRAALVCAAVSRQFPRDAASVTDTPRSRAGRRRRRA